MLYHLSIEPRKWQEEALRRWSIHKRGVVSAVTGAGKTVFAFLCVLDILREYPHASILVVVPTTALLDQWFLSLQEDLGVPVEDIALFSGEGCPNRPARFNLLVVNTARGRIAELSRYREHLLIVDECHRAGSQVNSKILSGSHLATLGISATPVREYDSGFEERVAPALGPILFEYSYEDALHDGAVAPFELVNVRIDLLAEERRRYNSLSRRIARLIRDEGAVNTDDPALKRMLHIRAGVVASAALRIPIAVKLTELNEGKRCIVFHERVSASNAILKLMLGRNIRATVYHTKVGGVVRQENLRLFRRGLYDTLVTCRALDEGLNVPETEVAVIASSSASTRQRIQRLGRVLRPAPGKTHSTIYTVYATDSEELRLSREATKLSGLVKTQWIKGSVTGYGANTCQ